MLFALMPLLASCGGASAAPAAAVAAAAPAVPVVAPPAPAAKPSRPRDRIGECKEKKDVASFTLVHMNDLQARYSERIAGKSRYARLAGIVRAVRDEAPLTLVVDAGDDYEKGSLLDLRTEGMATRKIVHAMPIDVRTLGNHDFAYGEAAVREDVRTSPHPVVLANVVDPSDSELFRPFMTIDVGCVKVGIFGLVTRPYDSDDEQLNANYGDFRHDSRFVTVAERIVRKYRGEVDVMIALSHLGKTPDVHVAREVEGLDLVVGAHSEDTLAKPLRVARTDGSYAYVVQAGHFGETIGRLELAVDVRAKKIDVSRYDLLPIDAAAPVDEEIDQLVTRLENESMPELHAPLATMREERSQRELVDLLAHAARQELDSDVVVAGKDAFWGKLPAGPITLQMLYDKALAQKQPVGTPGFTSLAVVEMSSLEWALLKRRFRRATSFVIAEAPPRAPGNRSRLVRIAVEKRVLEHPSLAFFGSVVWPAARFGGEIIDVLERYARAQQARGAKLDEKLR